MKVNKRYKKEKGRRFLEKEIESIANKIVMKDDLSLGLEGSDSFDKYVKSEKIYNDVMTELDKAELKYPQFHSLHEGYAVLKEEVDELWDMVKTSKKLHLHNETSTYNAQMKSEAIQVAAMAIRFIKDLL